MANVIIIDKNDKFLDLAEKLLLSDDSYTVVKSKTAEKLSLSKKLVEEHEPQLIIVGPSYKESESIGFVESVSSNFPTIGLIWIINEMDTSVMLNGLRSGYKDIVLIDDLDNILGMINNIAKKDVKLKDAILNGKNQNDNKDDDDDNDNHDGKMVSVFSTKGGVGKTFIATNLTVALAKESGKKVILVDLDLNFGDIGVFFNLDPKRTIGDIVSTFDRLDKEMLQSYFTKHTSGASILLSPVQPEASEKITSEHIQKILKLLRTMADYVIVDTPPTLSDTTLAVLDESDEIYLVATMDIPSIKNAKVSLQTMKLLGYEEDKIKLILNRSDSKVSLKPKEIEKTLNKKIISFIPSDRLAPQTINEGTSVVTAQPRSNMAKSLIKLMEGVKNIAGNRKQEKVLKEKVNVNK